MKFRKKAVAAVALSAVMACGMLAGCESLTSTNARKDYEQVVATVDITKDAVSGEALGKFGDEYKGYTEAIGTSEITKRDLVSLFASQGGSLVNSGYSYAAVFDSICDSLINRQVYIQYAKAYYLASGEYTVAGYEAAVAAAPAGDANGKEYSAEKKALEKDIAGLGYFLDEEEKAKAEYDLKVSVNEALDSTEESIIDEEEDEASGETVRTTPTGVGSENEDFYSNDYGIYTGKESDNALGIYEKVEGSTVTTRKKAYTQFLNNLRSYALLFDGENTGDIRSLVYYSMELKNAYESALLQKLNDSFEDEAEALYSEGTWVADQYANMLSSQIAGYRDDADSFKTALDGMSDTSFLLAAPEAGYGFVINILLPFSAWQTQELKDAPIDNGDTNGNKFSTRALLLSEIKATDQRGTWFKGDEDYSFRISSAAEGYGYKDKDAVTGETGEADNREYLFFKDNLPVYDANGALVENAEYETLKNYYGKYTYNGTVDEANGKYKLSPNKIDIDGFVTEMQGYLKFATYGEQNNQKLTVTYDKNPQYNTGSYYYEADDGNGHKKGDVNYEKFIYGSGKVSGDAAFNANKMFVRGSWENTAFSVINELSFAYNTDTAGLNTYLGYAVTPGKTDFVSEFEYAAQKVCALGAGNFIVAPSDYGWHIIYCTFSFTQKETSPFTYDAAQCEDEGTFSYLFYESLKSQGYASKKQSQIINTYAEKGSKKYEKRYADLASIG